MKHVKTFDKFIAEGSSGNILKKGFYFSSLSKGHEIRNKKTGKTYVVQSVGSDSAEIKDKNSSKFIGFTIMSLKDYEPVDSTLYEDWYKEPEDSDEYDEFMVTNEAARIPSNILDFAKRKGSYATSLVKKAATWAEKAGKYISGGTAIGKDYMTIVLDMKHQGSEIYINLNDETIELFGEEVTDAKSFAKVLSANASVNESHFKVGDKVKMSHGGTGVIFSLDKADGAEDEKYYNVKLPNGDIHKHSPNELTKEYLLDPNLNEALSSSILSSILDLKYANKDLLKQVYDNSKIQLDKIKDSDLTVVTPREASRWKGNGLVFYVSLREKQDPYTDGNVIPANSLLAVVTGERAFITVKTIRNLNSYRKTFASVDRINRGDSSIGIDKTQGLWNVKRIAEVSDIAYILDKNVLPNTNRITAYRADLVKGATAMRQAKDIRDENLDRYKQILATRFENDGIDIAIQNAVNKVNEIVAGALKVMRIGKYGDITAAMDGNREISMDDYSRWISRLMERYKRYVSYAEASQKTQDYEDTYYKGKKFEEASEIKKHIAILNNWSIPTEN